MSQSAAISPNTHHQLIERIAKAHVSGAGIALSRIAGVLSDRNKMLSVGRPDADAASVDAAKSLIGVWISSGYERLDQVPMRQRQIDKFRTRYSAAN